MIKQTIDNKLLKIVPCINCTYIDWMSSIDLRFILRQPQLLCVCEAVARVNELFSKDWLKELQTRMQRSRGTLSGSFKMFKFLRD